MKKKITLLPLLCALLLLFACGKDGSPGTAFISLDWDYYVDAYNDDNPSLPSTISRNFDYSTKAGVYNSQYACSDGSGNTWYWNYQYTIKIAAGEDGKLFRKGADGKDNYYKLFLNGLSTPTLSLTQKNAHHLKPKRNELQKFSLPKGEIELIGDPIVEEVIQNGFSVKIVKQQFKIN